MLPGETTVHAGRRGELRSGRLELCARQYRTPARGLLTTLLLLSLSSSAGAQSGSPAVAQGQREEIKFIGVFQDEDTTKADERLARFLAQKANLKFQKQTMPYGAVIRKFAEWDQSKNEGSYLARITPYAYVAAQMLGAQFDLLGIYKSAATHLTTYHAYFVVSKNSIAEAFWQPGLSPSPPTLDTLERYLKQSSKPGLFIYHDRFSTSSYFLPSLYFRAHHIFAMSQAAGGNLIPIRVERFPGGSSASLVKEVAAERANLAAVWDGTKKKFDKGGPSEKEGEQVYFIEIPTPLPNDLLVCSQWLNQQDKEAIRQAIRGDPLAGREAGQEYKDDFESWVNINDVPDTTLEALAKLRQSAREHTAPVTVKILKTSTPEYLDAARQAVRLSGTEFVLYDEDLHKRVDVTWKLEATHDGALVLTSSIEGSELEPQVFPISFIDKDDLPKRIADLMRSRMRRIRYIWPYEEKYPAVLRDFDFTPDNDDVTVQRISWMDPESNEYEQDTPFRTRIVKPDFNKLQLKDESQFPKNPDGSLNFEPMSNVAYRVILVREPRPGRIWAAMPYVFIGLFVIAAAGVGIDLLRKRPPPKGFYQTYQAMVEKYHRPWREGEIEESDVVWYDPAQMDQFVKDLRRQGRLMDLVRSGGLDFSLGPIPIKLSILMKIFDGIFRTRLKLPPELMESSEVGIVAALDNLIKFLAGTRRLSPFIGFPEQPVEGSRLPEKPLEWEALNDVASRHFRRLGISQKPVDASLRRDSPALSAVVSSHFHGILKKGRRDASFFRQTWKIEEIEENGRRYRLTHAEDLGGELRLATQEGPVTRVVVEFKIPVEPRLRDSLPGEEVDAWLLGRINQRSGSNGDGIYSLALQFKPIALLKVRDDAQR